MTQRQFTRKYFRIEDQFPPIEGITFGERWNGWECPLFTKTNVELLIKYLGMGDFDGMNHSNEDGTYYRIEPNTGMVYEVYIEDGKIDDSNSNVVTPVVVDGIEYFSIGGWNWIWSDAQISDDDTELIELIEGIHAQIDNREDLYIQLSEKDDDGRGNDVWTVDICIDRSAEGNDDDLVDSVVYYDKDDAESDINRVTYFGIEERD